MKRSWLILACGSLLLLAGCRRDIVTDYGERKGIAAKSVNGTAVLGEMFEHAGHRVSSWNALSPRLFQRADCIVWFPDDFQPPSQEVQAWLENWLANQPGRTLIYVGRDFDAAPKYWEAILPDAPADQQAEIRARKSAAQMSFRLERQKTPDVGESNWFSVRGKLQTRPVRSLDGSPKWLEGIDATETEIELHGRVEPADGADVLLRSDKDVLVSRLAFEESQVLVIANGSFLLNLPLVNHEHRKLAGHLIDEIGPPRKTVVFLESGQGGPPIRDEDPNLSMPTGLEIFTVWPANWILFHFALAGILFCFWRYPIFGRPLEPEPDSPSDFGKHVQALAELLERSGDTNYAQSRLAHYRQLTGK